MTKDYTQQLLEAGLRLTEPYKGAKQHHTILCLICNETFIATPLSKVQTYSKCGWQGCAKCTSFKKYEAARQKNLDELKDRGIELITPWNGQVGSGKESTGVMIRVRNTKCGHEFPVNAKNLMAKNSPCSVCGIAERTKHINKWSKNNSAAKAPTRELYARYRSKVQSITNKVYKKHKDIINPNDLPIGRCGEDGKFQLDHIVPVRWCFEHYVPIEMVAALDNLQMLDWRTNVGNRDNLKGELPAKFLPYADK